MKLLSWVVQFLKKDRRRLNRIKRWKHAAKLVAENSLKLIKNSNPIQ